MFVPNFKILGAVVPELSLIQISIYITLEWMKEKESKINFSSMIFFYTIYFNPLRGHPRAFREGEVLQQFQDFREKFWSKFWISLYILYIFTSPSVQDREKSASLGRLFLPNCPLGWPLTLWRCIQNLKTGSHKNWKICEEKLYWRERRNEQIKGMISRRILSIRLSHQGRPASVFKGSSL